MVVEGKELNRHNTEKFNPIFPEKELGSLSPNSYIYVSVSDFYIPTSGPLLGLQEKRWTDRENKQYRLLTDT